MGTHSLPAVPAELAVWLSPAFPVGAFAYSHGLEEAAARGWITDRAGLEDWLGALIRHGSLRNDLILVVESLRAARAGDDARLVSVNAEALALSPSAERHLESATQGEAFRAAMGAAWPEGAAAALTDGEVAYPVALGAAAAAHGLATERTLFAYGLAFVSNLVSAAIRLSLIGQSDGQRVIRALLPALDAAAREAEPLTLDVIGAATLRADLASLLHETLYSRLFRS